MFNYFSVLNSKVSGLRLIAQLFQTKTTMKQIITLVAIFMIISACTYSQTEIKATIKDSQTKEPLSFCNVLVKGTKKGTITNTDGVFSISVDVSKDILIFSYLGYETFSIQAEKLAKKTEVFLLKKEFVLQEVAVHADNEYLYDIMVKCRKKLMENKTKSVARVYYGLETDSKTISVEYPVKTNGTMKYYNIESDQKEKPVELLECFYNGFVSGTTVEELGFKNGRTALAAMDNYFLTLNSSKAITKIALTDKNDMFPAIPFQFNKYGMKKNFNIELQYFDGNNYSIKFYPLKDNKDGFSGEVWIEKETFRLLKINLSAKNTITHPFLPIFHSDSIYNVSFDITNTFLSEGNRLLPDHIYFNYSFTYRSRRDDTLIFDKRYYKNVTREIKSKGIMYFYDYDHPFILPYFRYSNDFDDYHKMSFIPYNDIFWNNNHALLQTAKQKMNYDLLSNEGKLINYREGNYGKKFLTELAFLKQECFFDFYYSFWSSNKRIVPNKGSKQFETYSNDKINQNIRSNLYNLKVQILLDITESNDSLICRSYTVFDNEQSFYHLPLNSYTNAFLNIYFDICEIERQKMQDKLNSKNFTASQIDSIYKEM